MSENIVPPSIHQHANAIEHDRYGDRPVTESHAEGLDRFVRENGRQLGAFSRRLDASHADDNLANLWLTMTRKFDRFPQSEWVPLSYVTLRRLAISASRRRYRHCEDSTEDVGVVTTGGRPASSFEDEATDRLWIVGAIEQLEPEIRLALITLEAEGSINAAATALGLERSKFFRLRSQLRDHFAEGRPASIETAGAHGATSGR